MASKSRQAERRSRNNVGFSGFDRVYADGVFRNLYGTTRRGNLVRIFLIPATSANDKPNLHSKLISGTTQKTAFW